MADHGHTQGKSSARWFVNNYSDARQQFLAFAADIPNSRVISKRVGADQNLLYVSQLLETTLATALHLRRRTEGQTERSFALTF